MTPVAPADTAASAPAAAASVDLQIPSSGPEYEAWRMKGVLPSEKPDDSATSDETPSSETPEGTVEPADSTPAPADTAAESATAPPQKRAKTKEDTARRFQEILTENKTLKQRLDEIERRVSQPAAAPREQPASQPAAAAPAKEPQLTDTDPTTGKALYRTYDDYLQAVRKFDREQIKAELRNEGTKAQQEAKQAEAKQVIAKVWGNRVTDARKKHADFDTVALNPELPIKEGSVTDAFILDSDHGAEVLYFLGQNPTELERIQALNPLKQARELFAIEQKFVKPAAAPRITKAPAPPHEVGGRGTVAADEVEAAVNDDDTASYMAAANRRDIARRKGK